MHQQHQVPHRLFIVRRYHQIVGHAVKIRNAANNTVWKRRNCGAHNANGRKHAAVLETENDQNRRLPVMERRRQSVHAESFQ